MDVYKLKRGAGVIRATEQKRSQEKTAKADLSRQCLSQGELKIKSSQISRSNCAEDKFIIEHLGLK